MIKIAIIGYGYWGPNLLRNFTACDGAEVAAVVDRRQERLRAVKKLYPGVEVFASAEDVMRDLSIDAVVVATPVFSHFPLASEALSRGKHVLIEKPMTTSSAQAAELIELAQKKSRVLMADHTFLYTGSVKKIKDIVDMGVIGRLQYFDSVRINLGLFNPEVNVVWDLAPHDISILLHINEEMPESVVATGISHTHNSIENIAYITLNYQSNLIAHFNCSWSSPVKIRKILIGGSNKMIVFDDVEPSEKLRIYDTSYKVSPVSDEDKYNILVDYRLGD
ncbi:partial putative oxidoreductase YdgJ, partial [Anaerolineae bacterium]